MRGVDVDEPHNRKNITITTGDFSLMLVSVSGGNVVIHHLGSVERSVVETDSLDFTRTEIVHLIGCGVVSRIQEDRSVVRKSHIVRDYRGRAGRTVDVQRHQLSRSIILNILDARMDGLVDDHRRVNPFLFGDIERNLRIVGAYADGLVTCRETGGVRILTGVRGNHLRIKLTDAAGTIDNLTGEAGACGAAEIAEDIVVRVARTRSETIHLLESAIRITTKPKHHLAQRIAVGDSLVNVLPAIRVIV